MLSDTVRNLLNSQLNEEVYSSHLYLSLSAWLESKNLKGMASFMRKQSSQELEHMRKLYKFMVDREGRVITEAIPAPPTSWGSPREAFHAAYGHEQKLSRRIAEMLRRAQDDNDLTTAQFLQWFVSEQAEEETTFRNILGRMEVVGDSDQGLYLLDREMANGGI